MFDIVENGYKHLVLSHSESRTVVVFVGAVVDNSIHVKLRTVRYLSRQFIEAVNEGAVT